MSVVKRELKKIHSVISSDKVFFHFKKLRGQHGLCYRTPISETDNRFVIVIDPKKEFFSLHHVIPTLDTRFQACRMGITGAVARI